MTVFWLTLVVVFISGYFAREYGGNLVIADGIAQSQPNKFFAFIAIAVLILVSGLRIPQGGAIGDTGMYTHAFLMVSNNFADSFAQWKLFNGDSGFSVFLSFIKEFISNDPQSFIFVCALITNLCICIVLYKYSAIFEVSLYLYITTGFYLVTMNGVRQSLVAAILFLCIRLITDGKWLPFFIVVLLVCQMHSSALVFIPLYFFARLEPWSKIVGIILAASIVVLLLFNEVGAFLLEALDNTQYGHYQEFILNGNAGANVFRTLIAAVPVVLAYQAKRQIANTNDKVINVVINFSVLNLVFFILAIQNWIFVRMSVYFELYVLLLFPWLIKNLGDKKTNQILYVSCFLCYLIYYYFEMVFTLDMAYKSSFIGL